MSDIGEIQPNVGVPPVKPAPTLQAKQVAGRPVETHKDRAEFSEIAHYLSEIRTIPDVRADKVQEVRAAIARQNLGSTDRGPLVGGIGCDVG